MEVFSIFNMRHDPISLDIFGYTHAKQFCQVTSICPEQSQDDLPPRRMSWLPQAENMLDVVSLPMSHHVVLKVCFLILDCVFAAASSHLECFHSPEHSHGRACKINRQPNGPNL